MSLEFKNPAKQLVIPLTKEPTVENIVEWVKNHNLVQTLLKQSSFPVQIQVSEGLQKGAMFVAN